MTDADGAAHATEWAVVVNDEEQYSIWRADREPPAGWYTAGMTGSQQACLDHIGRVWTDMRPASLRRQMDAAPARAVGAG